LLGEHSLSEIVSIELKKEPRPFIIAEIADRLNLSLEELKNTIERGKPGYLIYRIDDSEILIDFDHNASFINKIIGILNEHHEKNPILAGGLDAKEIIGKLGLIKFKAGKAYLELLLKQMEIDSLIECYNNTWIIKGHKPKFDKQTQEDIRWLENEILKCDSEKPVLTEIEERAVDNRMQKNRIKLYLSYLAGENRIKFYQNDFLHTKVLNKYRPILLKKLLQHENGISIPEYKELIGGTKRFRALLTDIFEGEKIIALQKGYEEETRIMITQTGKKIINADLS
jgi:hypothetical protein